MSVSVLVLVPGAAGLAALQVLRSDPALAAGSEEGLVAACLDAGIDVGAEATVATVLPLFVPVFVPTAALPEIPSATPASPVVSPVPPLGATGAGGSLVTPPPSAGTRRGPAQPH